MANEGIAAPVKMLEMIYGYRAMQVLHVATLLGIPDLLKDGPQSSEELARATGAHAGSLHRLLRAMAALDALQETDDGKFALTSLGACLRSDVPESLRGAVLLFGSDRHWSSWGKLLESVKTGLTVYGDLSTRTSLVGNTEDPAFAKLFNEGMGSLAAPVNKALPAAYPFPKTGRIVDVGAGHGALLASILHAHPGLRGTIFEIPQVVEGARNHIEAAGLAERCDVVAGNMFESVPEGDLYLIKSVMHNWSDDKCITILKNCRARISAGGRVLIVDAIAPQRAHPSPKALDALLLDLNMLLFTGSFERTEEQFRKLLEASGFRLLRVLPTEAGAYGIVEGEPA